VSEKEISLGEFLRQEREHKCITIEQVASATKIGVRTLHSLEENHYAELPAKPFIRGFVTSYCRFIGLDAKEVLSRFDSFINSKANERPNREAGHSGYAFEKKDGEQQGRTVLIIAIFSFMVIGGLAMIFLKPSLRHHRSSHIDKLRAAHIEGETSPVVAAGGSPVPASSVTPSPSPSLSVSVASAGNSVTNASGAAAPTPKATTVEKTKPADNSDGENKMPLAGANTADPLDSGLALKTDEIHHKIVFKIAEDIWVRYQVDDRPVRKFIIRKGKTLILRGTEQVRFQVSNPEAVSFNYNSHGFVPVGSEKNAVVKQGDTTLFFPNELSEKTEKPFGNDRPLPKQTGPKTDPSTQTSEPTP
jgi:cytoskeleton protein RodZ